MAVKFSPFELQCLHSKGAQACTAQPATHGEQRRITRGKEGAATPPNRFCITLAFNRILNFNNLFSGYKVIVNYI